MGDLSYPANLGSEIPAVLNLLPKHVPSSAVQGFP